MSTRLLHPSKLPYADFLRCEYWLSLAAYLKFHATFTCKECGAKPFPLGQGLAVHHKTYAHRGFEYPDHLDDLEVLCHACHGQRHEAVPAKPDGVNGKARDELFGYVEIEETLRDWGFEPADADLLLQEWDRARDQMVEEWATKVAEKAHEKGLVPPVPVK
jgi:hypothetical protein